MTKFLLDTNICIYIIKKKPEIVIQRLTSHNIHDCAISSITYAELIYGAEKSSNPEKNHSTIEKFIVPFAVLPWDNNCAKYYGEIRMYLEKLGKPIGTLDEMIAAHALSEELTLVTNNEKHFNRIPELHIENWV